MVQDDIVQTVEDVQFVWSLSEGPGEVRNWAKVTLEGDGHNVQGTLAVYHSNKDGRRHWEWRLAIDGEEGNPRGSWMEEPLRGSNLGAFLHRARGQVVSYFKETLKERQAKAGALLTARDDQIEQAKRVHDALNELSP